MATQAPQMRQDGRFGVAARIGPKRESLVREARSWVGCRYHHRARVKGAGIDCAYLLIDPAVKAGLIYDFDPLPYPPDWMFHRDEERYLETLELFCDEIEVDAVLPGDVVIWRFGRTFSHSGIVSGDPRAEGLTGWPWIVHAYAPARSVLEDRVTGSTLEDRTRRAYRVRGIDE